MKYNDFRLGEEVFDKFAMGNLVIEKQSFGVANKSSGFEDVDGILGCAGFYVWLWFQI